MSWLMSLRGCWRQSPWLRDYGFLLILHFALLHHTPEPLFDDCVTNIFLQLVSVIVYEMYLLVRLLREGSADVPKLFRFLHSFLPHALSQSGSSSSWGDGVAEDFPKPSQSAQLTRGQKTLGWFTLIRQEAQEWTRFCLISIIYGVLPQWWWWWCHMVLSYMYFSIWLLWGLKGKYWANLCLPLRIFLQVRLYRFNLLFL